MAEKWIQKAVKHPGALHKSLGVPAGQKIPAKKLAKAAGASGKLGQRARLAQTLGKMRGKTKKYAEGGGIDVGDIDLSSAKMPEDVFTFGQAYAAAKKSGDNLFTWRGKKYAVNPSPSKSSVGDLGETVVTAKRPGMDISDRMPAKGVGGRDYSDPFSGPRPNVDPEEYSQQARMEGTLGRMGDVASLYPPGRVIKGAKMAVEARAAANALKARRRANLARSLEKYQKSQASKNAAAGEWTDEFGLGMKRGGSVKRFAKGGGVRGHGCEAKGKSRGRFC